jgi:hypothetical protein
MEISGECAAQVASLAADCNMSITEYITREFTADSNECVKVTYVGVHNPPKE